jgi:hypothetical protein
VAGGRPRIRERASERVRARKDRKDRGGGVTCSAMSGGVAARWLGPSEIDRLDRRIEIAREIDRIDGKR